MALSVTVLGCSGTYAGPANACSGYLVRGGGATVWVDCGPGTLANLQAHVDLAALDAVVVSHSHPDHWTELPVFRNAMKYGERREGLPVYGTAATLRQLEAALGETVAPTFAWSTLTETAVVHAKDLAFSFSLTDHPVETFAMRITDVSTGVAMGYSADTGPGWSPRGLGPPLDLYLCEATLTDEFEGQAPHLTGRQAGRLAREAGVRRLVVTHVWPTDDPAVHVADAEDGFGGPVELAVPHATFEVTAP
jgi:ribonuclease BN (tRNA processing enzyme)